MSSEQEVMDPSRTAGQMLIDLAQVAGHGEDTSLHELAVMLDLDEGLNALEGRDRFRIVGLALMLIAHADVHDMPLEKVQAAFANAAVAIRSGHHAAGSDPFNEPHDSAAAIERIAGLLALEY